MRNRHVALAGSIFMLPVVDRKAIIGSLTGPDDSYIVGTIVGMMIRDAASRRDNGIAAKAKHPI